MAIPSGAGTEVLRRNGIYNQSTTVTNIDWAQAVQTATGNSSGTIAVPADVIITILNMTWCNRNGSAITVDIILDGTGDAIRILKSQSIGANGTFVFSDKLVLREGDVLQFDSSTANTDVHLNYIYQQF